MKKNHRSLFVFLFVAALLTAAAVAPLLHQAGAQSLSASVGRSDGRSEPKIVYPVTKKVDQIDDYFGTKVADPYRWLEDETSPETKAWVDEQNKVTFGYLDKIPYCEKLKARLTQLFNYPRISAPFHRGDTYFFTKNDGLQNQSVYYIQKGVNGKPEVFLDPNKFSTDGTSVNASRSSTSPNEAKAKKETQSSSKIYRRTKTSSHRSSPISLTTVSVLSTTSATNSSSAPTRTLRMVASSSSIRRIRMRATGETFYQKEVSRCRASVPRGANSSLRGAKTSRRARTSLVSTANSKTKSRCRVSELPMGLVV